MKSVQLGRNLTRFACSGLQHRQYSVVQDLPQTAGSFAQSSVPPPPQQTSSVLEQAANAATPRNNWTKDEVTQIHQTPLMELAFAAVGAYQDALNPEAHFILVTDVIQTRALCTAASTSLPLFSCVPL